jgi:hypothetical protein
MKLRVRALGLTFGIILGLWAFVAIIWAVIAGGGGTIACLGGFPLSFTVSVGGALLGLLWGIVCGFILGAVIAWLYNTLCKMLYKSETSVK